MARRAEKTSVEASSFLIVIKTPNRAYRTAIAGRTPCRLGNAPSLPLVRRRENPFGSGIAMMRAVVLRQPRGAMLCGGMLGPHSSQQLGGCREKHGFACRRPIALDHIPAQARLPACHPLG